MNEVRALIEQLVAVGVDPIEAAEIITRAAIAGASAIGGTDASAERRREKDRIRKRLRKSAESAEIQGTTPIPDKEAFPQTPIQEINPKSPPYSPPSRQRFADPAIVLQSILDPMTAKRWVDHLAQKRRPLSGPAAEGVVAELRIIKAQGGNPVEAITLAISKNWNTVTAEFCRNAGMKFTLSAPDTAEAFDWGPALAGFANDGFWPASFGPKPGEAGCKVPASVVALAGAAA